MLLKAKSLLAIEASIADYWQRYTGLDGDVIGMTSFMNPRRLISCLNCLGLVTRTCW